MPEPRITVLASRELLQQVCALLEPFRDNAVLIGGWVPEIRFPDAGYVGTIDVDFATRMSVEGHRQVVTLLLQSGFRAGAEPYQFVKNMPVGGRSYAVRLDLLTSRRHHQAVFGGDAHAPHPAAGADPAFADNTIEIVGAVEVRVASIVPLIVMKGTLSARAGKTEGCLRPRVLPRELSWRRSSPRRRIRQCHRRSRGAHHS